MTASQSSAPSPGLEVGRRRVLHPGPLRWLRALAWMVPLFLVAMTANLFSATAAMAALDGGNGWVPLMFVAVACLTGLGAYAGAVRLAEDRWPEELNLRRAPADLLAGLLAGALLFSAVMAVLLLSGGYAIAGLHAADPLWAVNMGLSSGVTEELVMRAVIFRLAMRAFGVWPALVLSAGLFGVMHLANPNATPVAVAAIAVEAGLMLAGFYLMTGRLWMSFAFHAAWNFTQGYIFGAAVSGSVGPASLWISKPVAGAPAILTGGAFGPEASAPAMVIGTLAAVATLIIAHRRGNLRARPDDA
ncbi:MAG: CPBP family intramembrane metalloprotease [Caulobacter sp.]|nr:CPBP family intramembrane metalloprotease [Caulobacter sp.]